MAELLLELFSEEIPAHMQADGAARLARLVGEELARARLSFESSTSYVTPRRLVLIVDGLPRRRPDIREEKRGPRVDAPDRAVEGFLRANGLTREDCVQRASGKAVFWFAVVERAGGPTSEALPDRLAAAVAALSWPKSMRWGTGQARWVRPLERGLCLFDGAPLPFALPGGAPVGGVTTGHRFLAPAPIPISSAADYRARLRAARVVLDPAERRRIVVEGGDALAAAEGLAVARDPRLVDEVAGLVEWPVPLMGRIDAEFMAVPAEVLTAAMRTHQRYFPVHRPDGALAPRFVVIANADTEDGGAQIVAGNERVLRARLSDAKFFWDQDRRRSLADRVADLATMVFQEGLGSLADKAARLETLAGEIAASVAGADAESARRAGRLAKADLTTEMVGEFPELQGRIGRHYALHDGETESVARAIAAHYAPRGPSDPCPDDPLSTAVALADKIDSLVGFFTIGARPTGSGDPYALRRAALGIVRLVLENGIRIGLRAAVRSAYRGYEAVVAGFGSPGSGHADADAVENELVGFIAERLRIHLRAQGVRHDLVSAVFALSAEDDLVRLRARAAALERFLADEDGANLLTAYRRASNIVAIEERKDGRIHDGPAEPALFSTEEETALHDRLLTSRERTAPLIAAERFDEAMGVLAALRRPVDAFFDSVTVNSADPSARANRLRLLSAIRTTMADLADFSRIEG